MTNYTPISLREVCKHLDLPVPETKIAQELLDTVPKSLRDDCSCYSCKCTVGLSYPYEQVHSESLPELPGEDPRVVLCPACGHYMVRYTANNRVHMMAPVIQIPLTSKAIADTIVDMIRAHCC